MQLEDSEIWIKHFQAARRILEEWSEEWETSELVEKVLSTNEASNAIVLTDDIKARTSLILTLKENVLMIFRDNNIRSQADWLRCTQEMPGDTTPVIPWELIKTGDLKSMQRAVGFVRHVTGW